MVVDLPAPFGPSRPNTSPASTSSGGPLSATISGFGCFSFFPDADFPRAPGAGAPPLAPIGGAECYTLRKSRVRIPTMRILKRIVVVAQFEFHTPNLI